MLKKISKHSEIVLLLENFLGRCRLLILSQIFEILKKSSDFDENWRDKKSGLKLSTILTTKTMNNLSKNCVDDVSSHCKSD